MPPKKLSTSDTRMLALMKWAVETGVADNSKDFCEQIGFSNSNLYNVKTGHQSFTRDNITVACKITGANANWILGLEPNMLRKDFKDPLDQIKQAVASLEAERKKKK